MTWAHEWRSTSRASGSLSVRIWKVCSPSVTGNSRSMSMILPSSFAAMADALGHVARAAAGGDLPGGAVGKF
jgi:hypothetical protein